MSYTGYTVEDIEDAIIATLKADATLAAYVRTFERMPWENIAELERLLKNYPAIVVAYQGGADDNDTYGVCGQGARFSLLCANQSVRAISSAARLAGMTNGVYGMLKDVLECLNFSSLGLDIISCISTGVRVVAVTPSLTIFSRDFTVTWRLVYG
jgi:phage gp37-like protein